MKFSFDEKIYNIHDDIWSYINDDFLAQNKKKVKYLNIPAAFDIETSSFLNSAGEKQALTYIWMLGINGKCLIGRTWLEFDYIIRKIANDLKLHSKKRLIIYVHNLGYEFQFMRKLFTWEKVFCISERSPIYALTDFGIEFRCSYLLTGYKLETVGKNLLKYKIEKLVGFLEYDKIRTPITPLTSDELAYCINDIKIVMSAIQEKIEIDGGIDKIPLTVTGYARNYTRSQCLYIEGAKNKYKSRKFFNYRLIMDSLILTPEEFEIVNRAFMGGYVHTNPTKSGLIFFNVNSIDFTSSYPFQLVVSPRYPMGRGKFINIKSKEDFEYYIKYYCCIFECKFNNLYDIFHYDNYISSSRSYNIKNGLFQNGRVISADSIEMTITEVDFEIIQRTYKWDSMQFGRFIIYPRGYLPTDLVKSVLNLYKDKTELKGIKGMEQEYMRSKGLINSVYGMMVTNILRDEIEYNNDIDFWEIEEGDPEELINKYNKSWSRFLFYPWGIYCTALSRKALWSGILEFKEDYIYCDTDSLKVLNIKKHQKYIDAYNNSCIDRLKKAMKYHNLDFSLCSPKTKDGIEKPLGVWDDDGHYKRFKAIRAKTYIYEYDNGDMSFTIAGLNKNVVMPFLNSKYSNDEIFDMLDDGFTIDAEHTGKLTHTYIDDYMSGEVVDYLGNKYKYTELSGINLSKQDYKLSLASEYVDYIKHLQFEYGGSHKNEILQFEKHISEKG